MKLSLPFPSAELSGHAKGHWRSHSTPTADHRYAAYLLTLEAAGTSLDEVRAAFAGKGDIRIHVRFVPPDHRGDRWNFPHRAKAQADGIADALQVNDKRFLPTFEFAAPEKANPRVEVTLG